MFSRLRDSLSKSRRALTGELAAAAFDPGNELDWERLEEALIMGDVGVRATAELVQRLEARGDVGEDLEAALAEEIESCSASRATLDVGHDPAVLLVVGVNGTGKTTTIGKLAAKLPSTDARSSSPRPTPSAPRRRSSWRSGPSAPVRTSSAPSAAPTPPRSPTTGSRRRRRAAATSSSSTPPGACTRRRT